MRALVPGGSDFQFAFRGTLQYTTLKIQTPWRFLQAMPESYSPQ